LFDPILSELGNHFENLSRAEQIDEE